VRRPGAGPLSEAGVTSGDWTGESIARMQEPSGAIPWPDGHVDAWDHVECAMALSACGLREPARRAYRWLRETQRADGSWPRSAAAAR
jgi:GH15 family glucan-1,4-alpha-glucosidase